MEQRTAVVATTTATMPIAAASISLFFFCMDASWFRHLYLTAQVKYAIPAALLHTSPGCGSWM